MSCISFGGAVQVVAANLARLHVHTCIQVCRVKVEQSRVKDSIKTVLFQSLAVCHQSKQHLGGAAYNSSSAYHAFLASMCHVSFAVTILRHSLLHRHKA